MPSLLTEAVRCESCHREYPRYKMAPLGGVCLNCFDRYFSYCARCSTLLTSNPNITIDGAQRRQSYRGVAYCYNCLELVRYTGEQNYWRATPLDHSQATYKVIKSTRKYGVEIETSCSPGHCDLRGKTHFGTKNDCTIQGYEHDSPIMYGDEGLEKIQEILDFAATHNWEADEDCGCHTHYDMRDETEDAVGRIAYAYVKSIKFWDRMIPGWRHENCHTNTPSYRARDLRDAIRREGFVKFAEECDRYDFINLQAYGDHCTLEVRSLEGTTDPELVCNWIILNCRFIDHVSKLAIEDIDRLFRGEINVLFETIKTVIGSDMADWVDKRRQYCQNNYTAPIEREYDW